MATSLHKINSLDEIFNCPVCIEKFCDPRILSCGHHFCKDCLESILQSEKTGSVPCPTCRQKTRLESGSEITDLPRPVMINELQGLISSLLGKRESQVVRFCDLCGPKEVTGTYHCYRCKQNLCDKCHQLHMKVKMLASHKTVLIAQVPEIFCKSHPDQVINAFCLDCDSAICFKCVMVQHIEHNVEDLQYSLEETKKRLRNFIRHHQKYLIKEELINKVQEKKINIMEKRDSLRQLLCQLRETLRDFQQHLDQVEDEAETIAMASLKQINIYQSDMHDMNASRASLIDYAQYLLDTASAPELIMKGAKFPKNSLANKAVAECNVSLPVYDENLPDILLTLKKLIKRLDVSYRNEVLSEIRGDSGISKAQVDDHETWASSIQHGQPKAREVRLGDVAGEAKVTRRPSQRSTGGSRERRTPSQVQGARGGGSTREEGSSGSKRTDTWEDRSRDSMGSEEDMRVDTGEDNGQEDREWEEDSRPRVSTAQPKEIINPPVSPNLVTVMPSNLNWSTKLKPCKPCFAIPDIFQMVKIMGFTFDTVNQRIFVRGREKPYPIKIYTTEGALHSEMDFICPGQNLPRPIAYDSKRNLLLVTGKGYLFKLSSTPPIKRGMIRVGTRVWGIAYCAEKDLYIVSDVPNEERGSKHCIIILDASTGKRVLSFGTSGGGLTQFDHPFYVTAGKTMMFSEPVIIITDCSNRSVKLYGLDGTLLKVYGGFRTGEDVFASPGNTVIDPSGRVLVTNSDRKEVLAFWTEDGKDYTQVLLNHLDLSAFGVPYTQLSANSMPSSPPVDMSIDIMGNFLAVHVRNSLLVFKNSNG